MTGFVVQGHKRSLNAFFHKNVCTSEVGHKRDM